MRKTQALTAYSFLFFLTIFLTGYQTSAQGVFVPLGGDTYHYIDRLDIKYSRIVPISHTADKSYYRGNVAKVAETLLTSNLKFRKVQQFQIQYLADDNPDWLDTINSRTRRPLFKVLYREPTSFAHVSSKKKGLWDLRFNPCIELRLGGETDEKRFTFQRVLGLEVRGNIKRTVSFYFNVFGNSARLPAYVTDRMYDNRYGRAAQQSGNSVTFPDYVYVPGQAYWKKYESKIFKFSDGIDYFDARGYVNVHVLKHINITFGRDKFFIGNGQRSFMLSDFAAPYLFLKYNVNIWRFNYTSIIAQITQQYVRGADQLLAKKYMAVHHLSMQATHWLNIGLFEGVIMNRSKQFEPEYLNPIIFYRAVEHALGSPDNVMIGLDWKANMFGHMSFYGQFVLDEFNFKEMTKRSGWRDNKWALQVGLKYIDLAPNFDLQAEFNLARPFIYSERGLTNYSHYNQPLAHPLGANFYEFIVNARYQPLPRLAMNAKLMVARVGDDSLALDPSTGQYVLTNYGGNILRMDDETQAYGNKIGQGAKGTITYFQFMASYQAWHNIYFDLEATYRSKSNSGTNERSKPLLQNRSTFYVNIGVRMNIPYRSYMF